MEAEVVDETEGKEKTMALAFLSVDFADTGMRCAKSCTCTVEINKLYEKYRAVLYISES